eukprot:gene826-1033_t
MSTTGITTSSLVLFRRIIREGMRYPSFRHNPWWRINIRENFKSNKDVTDPKEIKTLQDKIKSYRYLLKSTKDLQDLLEEHNIGLGSRERIEKSSARVGLKVPEWPEARDKRIKDRVVENQTK